MEADAPLTDIDLSSQPEDTTELTKLTPDEERKLQELRTTWNTTYEPHRGDDDDAG